MGCYHPLTGWRSKTVNSSGKRSIVFDAKLAFRDMHIEVPCGQCIGCRLERSRQWAVRCVHEASLHEANCFITLTYSPDKLPKNGSLDIKHFQDFMKRLRKEYGNGIRYFHCGEYGEQNTRPHYHACIFNFDFPDKEKWKINNGYTYYTSAKLEKLWGHGFCTVGELTFETAAYVARYVTKKITGTAALSHYGGYLDNDGVPQFEKHPEYITMSRRPGIASGWYDKYKKDVYNYDSVVIKGKEIKPPKYYDSKFDIDEPKEMYNIKLNRKFNSEKMVQVGSKRMHTKLEVQKLRFKQLKRSYEQSGD